MSMTTRGSSGRGKGPQPGGAPYDPTSSDGGGSAIGGYYGGRDPAAPGPDRSGSASPTAPPLPGSAAAVSASASSEHADPRPSPSSYYESRPPGPQHLVAGTRPGGGVRTVTAEAPPGPDPSAAFEPPQSRPGTLEGNLPAQSR